MVTSFFPDHTHADIVSDIFNALTGKSMVSAAAVPETDSNIQTLSLLKPSINEDSDATGGGDITIVDNSAVVPDEGPSGTLADIERPQNATISLYVVRDGDTLSSIAKLFDVSPNTILWANDLPANTKLYIGEQLTILPVTGVRYTIKKGDTLASIAKRFSGDAADIGSFNGVDDDSLNAGDVIIIPNGEVSATQTIASTGKPTKATNTGNKGSHGRVSVGNEPAHDVGPQGTADEIAYYIAPLSHYIRTQGIHGYNAVDLAAPIGTPIMASADGTIIVARQGGWNGGYGNYVVIQHQNGSQTLYGHASRVIVSVGQHVEQGQVIGYVGETGLATGPHVHFEIRDGIKNPF